LSEVNAHGLSRDIPDPIKREVRQRCGFGCVNCGRAVYQYEHLDPEFVDATLHDPKHIVLLCGWCHDLVTRGLLSKDSVKEKAENPKCKESGFSFGPFDIGNNEWRSPTTNWDVEVVGQRIIIRSAARDLALILRTEPPQRIVVERMRMLHKGIRLECWEDRLLEIVGPDGSTIRSSGAFESDGWEVGIDADATGIRIGRGGTMRIRTLEGRANSTIASAQASLAPLWRAPRNAPCSCGGGLKFKHCHGRIVK
jgi:hypothetical protein